MIPVFAKFFKFNLGIPNGSICDLGTSAFAIRKENTHFTLQVALFTHHNVIVMAFIMHAIRQTFPSCSFSIITPSKEAVETQYNLSVIDK